jgi:hypothetical protein
MNEIFRRLHQQIFEAAGPGVLPQQSALAPIEQTVDGWFCLRETGDVVHWSTSTRETEAVLDAARKAALIGRLAVQFPLATWFLPAGAAARVCRVPGLPAELADKIVCECGGLGWTAE